MSKNLKIDVTRRDLSKIINGLFCIRAEYAKIHHLTFIDIPSEVDKPLKKEVAKIDDLISRMYSYYTEDAEKTEIELKKAGLKKKNVV